MSKLKLVTIGAAAVFSVMCGLSMGAAVAAEAPAADKADAAAPADPDTAAAPADAAPDAGQPDAAAPADSAPETAPEPAKPTEGAKPMKAPAAVPAAPEKSAAAPAAQPQPVAKASAAPVTQPAAQAVAGGAAAGNLSLGASVVGADGKEIGKINRVSAGPSGAITEIHVNTSGAAGLSGAIVAIPGDKIASGGDKVKLSLTSDEVSKLPKVDGSKG
jgi:outer membrane biosynthesis protein TonB